MLVGKNHLECVTAIDHSGNRYLAARLIVEKVLLKGGVSKFFRPRAASATKQQVGAINTIEVQVKKKQNCNVGFN